jgi:hypothetical protein
MIIKRLQKWKQQIDKELAQEIKFFRRTNIFEKIAASAINVIFISIVAIPTYFYLGWTLKFKIAVGLIFFIGSHFPFTRQRPMPRNENSKNSLGKKV